MTRKEAKQRGERFYTPFKPCPKCGTHKRYTSGGNCFACHVEWNKNYSPEKRRDQAKQRYARDPHQLERIREWQRNNRDKMRAACLAWAKNNPARCSAKTQLRKARKLRATPPWLDPQACLDIYAECQRLTDETNIKHHVDHIIPLKSPIVCGLHVPWNLQILTAEENIRKSNDLPPAIQPRRVLSQDQTS